MSQYGDRRGEDWRDLMHEPEGVPEDFEEADDDEKPDDDETAFGALKRNSEKQLKHYVGMCPEGAFPVSKGCIDDYLNKAT